jgi:hypothetical protein
MSVDTTGFVSTISVVSQAPSLLLMLFSSRLSPAVSELVKLSDRNADTGSWPGPKTNVAKLASVNQAVGEPTLAFPACGELVWRQVLGNHRHRFTYRPFADSWSTYIKPE